MAIGGEAYQVPFPFVEQVDNRPVKLIKPLHLAQDRLSKITDHGGSWLFRLDELKRRHKIPDKALCAVAGPDSNTDDRRLRAFEEMVGRLQEIGVEVTDYANREHVLTFARRP